MGFAKPTSLCPTNHCCHGRVLALRAFTLTPVNTLSLLRKADTLGLTTRTVSEEPR